MAGRSRASPYPTGSEADIAGVFTESVDAGAFGTIGDVILNRMHDRGEPLARTEGGGLTFEDGPSACGFAPTSRSTAPTCAIK